ncbi:hypothetical protein HRG_010236 [Hirsutella rhossiliensis]|uniref:Uncharacterized protein n=1 Tax=Hirsutella rhossiliensis TaxID=111463 RepID=A0A9P8SE33_9HYPO|nr:uncharacterized protein HRG_10236 [Hirsutella rhossiliensis]KAH0958549.1 hypothetical protein HRG_10236 [Hirsutella rhossiliensis]
MNRFFPLAALAVAPLAEARLNRLVERHNAAECCPCPAPGAPNQPVTVTVTQQAPAPAPQTVTVERVVAGPPAPVYVTQNNNNNNNNINNNNVGYQGQPQAVTVVNNRPQQETLTVTSGGVRPDPAPYAGFPNVTATAGPRATDPASSPKQPVESPSRPREGSPNTTKTITVIPQPSVQDAPAAPVTVTVPPMQPQGTGTGPYQTVTQTVQGGGGDNIEIIIININTGETSCKKKHSGKPCHRGHGNPVVVSSRPCPSAANSTSIATVFNTVSVVVGGPSRPSNGTASAMGAAKATGMTKRSEGRKPRAPLSPRTF